MGVNHITDNSYLSGSDNSLKVPFRVLLKSDNQHVELICRRIFRVLDGKRLICFGGYNEEDVVVKFFCDPKRGKEHCIREERGFRVLKEAGIKTPSLLFKGLVKPGCEPVLVFRMIDQPIDFIEAWEQVKSDNRRAELLKSIVSIIAHQHEAGLIHNDLNLGTFLLSGNDIYTIDGDARYKGNPLSKAKSLENLGLFFAQIYPRFDHLVADSFNMYLEKRAWSKNIVIHNRLMKKIRRQRKKREKKYLKKIYRECSTFICKKSWDRFLIYDRNYNTEKMVRFLADPDALINHSRLLKDGNTTTVALVEVDSQRLVVKRYNIKNIWHAIRRYARPSRAWRVWRNAHRLVLLGILTPKPIALLEKRWGPFRSKAYFITEYVDGIDVYHLLHSDRGKEVDQNFLTKQFGELFQSLIDASIRHGDFKATNFIVVDNDLFIIDLDAMREHEYRYWFRRAFNRDLERFMQNWSDLSEVGNIFSEQIRNLEL